MGKPSKHKKVIVDKTQKNEKCQNAQCENGQITKIWKLSKGKNVETFKTQKCKNCQNAKNFKPSKHTM